MKHRPPGIRSARRAIDILLLLVAINSRLRAQGSPSAPTNPTALPEIAVVGLYHFTGGGSDAVTAVQDDHRSERRARELAAVIERLRRFRPTRILVEAEPSEQAALDSTYASIRRGQPVRRASEIELLAMPLAHALGHASVIGVDYRNMVDFALPLGQVGDTARVARLFKETLASAQRIAARLGDTRGTVAERLTLANSAEFNQVHGLYLLLAQMGATRTANGAVSVTSSGGAASGATEAARWWERNLRIFSNILAVSGPGDRVLVLFGAGHKYLLEEFIRATPNARLVSAW